MRFLRNVSIGYKLPLTMLATLTFSLVLVAIGVLAYELLTYRNRMAAQMTRVADFVAATSAPSLLLENPQAARQTLLTLQAYPEIALAMLYTKEGRPFAALHPGKRLAILPTPPPREGIRQVKGELEIVRPVMQQGERIGTVLLRVRPAGLQDRLIPYAGVLLVSALAIGSSTFLLQILLRRMVSAPVLQLARAAERIAAGDLAARVPVESADEVGHLAQAFNRMTAELAKSYAEGEDSRRRLQNVIDGAQDTIIFVKDLDGRYITVNRFFEILLARSREELNVKTDFDLFTRERAEVYRAHDMQALASGRLLKYEEPVITATGEERLFLSSKFPLFESDGEPYAICCISVDITDRKRTEEELRQLTEELEQRVEERTAELTAANRELEAFAYTVSHDLRAPLRHITSFVGLLTQNTECRLDEKNRRYLQIISESAIRMEGMIDDLLTLSRIGRSPLSMSPVDLNELVEEARRELSPEAAERSIDWRIGRLPAVMGDRGLLRTVLVNLLGNALKYTRNCEPAVIEIDCRKEPGEAACYVRDNGAGFDMRLAGKLFGVFQRLHPSEEFEGTGIGLASVRRIIERHGGRVWAEGEIGRGASFYFSLPTEIPKEKPETNG